MQEVQSQECNFYMDGLLKKNLDITKETIKKDWDFIFCIDGVEGGGKSVFAQQVAKYCDPTFNIDRICFEPDEFKNKVIAAKQYQAIVYDEALSGLSSKDTMTQTNKTIVKMLAEIRQKNLFIFIVLPTFFDLSKNVAVWRSRGLFHIYLGKNFQRGYYKFYNYVTKKFLYMKGKKLYNYYSVLPNLKGKFINKYTVDEKEYRKKKLETLQRYSEKDEKKEPELYTRCKKQRAILLQIVLESYSQKDIAKILGVNRGTVGDMMSFLPRRNSLTGNMVGDDGATNKTESDEKQ